MPKTPYGTFSYDLEDDEEEVGLDFLDTSMGYGLDYGNKGALDDEPNDTSQAFGVPSRSKNHQLLESENELHLEKYQGYLGRYSTPDYDMTPSQAFATSVLAILPTAFGYVLGGNQGASQASGLYEAGAGQMLKNFEQSDKEERGAAKELANYELKEYERGRQRLEQKEDKDEQYRMQAQLQEDRQDHASDMHTARTGGAQGRSTAALQRESRFQRAEQRNLTSRMIPGLGVLPGTIPDDKDKEAANDLFTDAQRSIGSLSRLKSIMGDIKSTVADKEAALSNVVIALKDLYDMGANFTPLEKGLVDNQLPANLSVIEPEKLISFLREEFKGQDAAEKIQQLVDIGQNDLARQLATRKYFIPGVKYPEDVANQFGVPRDEQGLAYDDGSYFDSVGLSDAIDYEQTMMESGFNPNAIGADGDYGLKQLREPAVTDVARARGVDPIELMERIKADPQTNLEVGREYYEMKLKEFGGDRRRALMAYNAGSSRVRSGRVPKSAVKYADTIMSRAQARIESGEWPSYEQFEAMRRKGG